jgi:hypothetical protein
VRDGADLEDWDDFYAQGRSAASESPEAVSATSKSPRSGDGESAEAVPAPRQSLWRRLIGWISS